MDCDFAPAAVDYVCVAVYGIDEVVTSATGADVLRPDGVVNGSVYEVGPSTTVDLIVVFCAS
jgi:hypothetical protein